MRRPLKHAVIILGLGVASLAPTLASATPETEPQRGHRQPEWTAREDREQGPRGGERMGRGWGHDRQDDLGPQRGEGFGPRRGEGLNRGPKARFDREDRDRGPRGGNARFDRDEQGPREPRGDENVKGPRRDFGPRGENAELRGGGRMGRGWGRDRQDDLGPQRGEGFGPRWGEGFRNVARPDGPGNRQTSLPPVHTENEPSRGPQAPVAPQGSPADLNAPENPAPQSAPGTRPPPPPAANV